MPSQKSRLFAALLNSDVGRQHQFIRDLNSSILKTVQPLKENKLKTLIVVEAITRTDRTQDAIQFLDEKFRETLELESCQDITTYLGEDGHTLIVIQHWNSKDEFDEYFAGRQESGDFDDFVSMLQGAPNIRAFDAVNG